MSAAPRADAEVAGLCSSCRHARTVASKRSSFLRCQRSDLEPEFARYPSLPIWRCSGHEAAEPERAAVAGNARR